MPAIQFRELQELAGSNVCRKVRINVNGQTMACTGCTLTDEGDLELSVANSETSVDLVKEVNKAFPTSGTKDK